jgi:serine/threonine protein kinase
VAKVPDQAWMCVGRGSAADVVVPLERLSKVHARVAVRDDGRLAVKDAGSKNGVVIGHARLDPEAEGSVDDGGVLGLGPYPFRAFSPRTFVAWLLRLREAEQQMATVVEARPGGGAPFVVVGHLGQGGMGDVVLARRLDRDGREQLVAVKRLLPEYAAQAHFVDMFLQEARIATRIDDDHAVRIVDVGWDGPRPYIAMEFVDGWDLATILRVVRSLHQQVPVDVACRIGADLCAGLAAAHACTDDAGAPLHIVHRDVSPHNVLVARSGIARLSDFGISKAADSLRLTRTGELKGKLPYLAPEQLVSSLGPTDQRADIFATATTVVETLTAKPLFRRQNDIETMEAVLRDPIVDVRERRAEVPADVAAVLLQALARRPDERLARVSAIGDVLRAHAASRDDVAAWLRALAKDVDGKSPLARPPAGEATEVLRRR